MQITPEILAAALSLMLKGEAEAAKALLEGKVKLDEGK